MNAEEELAHLKQLRRASLPLLNDRGERLAATARTLCHERKLRASALAERKSDPVVSVERIRGDEDELIELDRRLHSSFADLLLFVTRHDLDARFVTSLAANADLAGLVRSALAFSVRHRDGVVRRAWVDAILENRHEHVPNVPESMSASL